MFQYATGISGAHALARGVLDGGDGAAARYLEFLSAGDSLYPLDALERAGVDLRSPEPVEQTFAVLASLVDRIEALLDGDRLDGDRARSASSDADDPAFLRRSGRDRADGPRR